MTVLLRPRALANVDAAVEGFNLVETVAVGDASVDFVITPEVEYAAVPVVVGIPFVAPVGALTHITRFAVTARSTTSITVTVTFNAAPGGAVATTCRFDCGLVGVPAR